MPADMTDTQPPTGPEVENLTGVDVSAARRALADVEREPGSKKPDPIVVADNVRRTFGGLTAVDELAILVVGQLNALGGAEGVQ